MAGFLSGSAYGMARDISEGYLSANERTFKNLQPAQLDQLAFEMDRHLRELRGEQPPLDDQKATQKRNRRIQRLNGTLLMLRTHRQKTRR